MSLLVDPHICPDCRAPLDATSTCTGCGLVLVGPLAVELWQHMQQADRLVEQLRSASSAPVARPPERPLPDAPPASSALPPRRALPSASVPVVLLALGGLCLLVAAVVFVAVAWSSLGLAAKTLILLTVTLLLGAAAVAVTRRELRFAAETLWLVLAGLVAVDVGAAYGADLGGLARLGDRGAVALLGAALLGVAVAVGAWATGTALGRVHGLVGVAAVGTVLVAGSQAWFYADNPRAVAISVPVLALVAWAVDRATDGHLRATALVVAAAAVVSWLLLLGYGVDRMTTGDSRASWWTELPGWPLLAAAGLAAAASVPTRAPVAARSVAAGGCLAALALFTVGPDTGPTADLLAWACATALVSLVAGIAPLIWSHPAAALSAVGLVGWSVVTLARPVWIVADLPSTASADSERLDLHLPPVLSGPAPWTALVAALAVGACAGGVLRHLPRAHVREAAGRAFIALGPGVLALGATTVLLGTEPVLWAAVVAWAATTAVAAAMAVTARRQTETLAVSLGFLGYLVVLGLRLAVPSHLLAAALATTIALALAVAYARAERDLLQELLLPLLAGSTVLTTAFAAAHWPWVAGGYEDAAGLTLACAAAAALLLARPAGRDPMSRRTLEATGLLAGLAATQYPVDDTLVAAVLTIVGSAVALVAVLNDDREAASWLALPILGLATVLRAGEGDAVPELSTLPAAVALLAAGWWRLDRAPGLPSSRALGSGLTLGLAPSLLLALEEPVSLRGALVATGGLALLAVGAARAWAAPLLAGGLTTGVLALRHLGPVVDALPRWISLGSVGVALLLVGVTWEQRRRDLATAGRYLASLR